MINQTESFFYKYLFYTVQQIIFIYEFVIIALTIRTQKLIIRSPNYENERTRRLYPNIKFRSIQNFFSPISPFFLGR
jgi:hypothetical protein